MNLNSTFFASLEWKLYSQTLNDPRAAEYLLRIFMDCENRHKDNPTKEAWLTYKAPKHFALIADAPLDMGQGIIDALLESELMLCEGGVYRLIGWEAHNSSLIASRTNGKKGGRPVKVREDKGREDNLSQGKERERNVSEVNRQVNPAKPKVNPKEPNRNPEETTRSTTRSETNPSQVIEPPEEDGDCPF